MLKIKLAGASSVLDAHQEVANGNDAGAGSFEPR